MNRVCACIIARLNSTRLPRKVLKEIEGKPLLKWIVDRLKAVKNIDEVVLCTSSDPEDAELLNHAEEWGISAIAGSPDNIVSRLQQVVNTFKADLLLRATGDNPLISVNYTEQLIEAHKESDFEYSRITLLPIGSTVEGISKNILTDIQNTLPSPTHSEYLLLYAFRPDLYKCTVLRPPDKIQRPYYSVTVDTPEDLNRVRAIYQGTEWSSEFGPSIEQVVAFLDGDEGYEPIPGNAMIKVPGKQVTYDKLLNMMAERAEKSTTIDCK